MRPKGGCNGRKTMVGTSDAVTGEIVTRRGLYYRKTTMAVNLTKFRALYCPSAV